MRPFPKTPKFKDQDRLGHLLLLCLCLFVFWTNIRAVDFGEHFDESHPILEPIQMAVLTGMFLPRVYRYPSFCFDLGLVALIPDLVKSYVVHKGHPPEPSIDLSQVVDDKAYVLRMRSIVILFSLVSMVSLYVGILRWRKNWIEAFLASAIYGLSWETAYHNRFFTPDSPMTQFGSLVLLFLIFAVTSERPYRYLRLGAIGAGLAAGCKYPSALLIVPVLIAAYRLRGRLGQPLALVKLSVLSAFAYLCTTPGTVIEPSEFWRWVSWQMSMYAGGRGGYTVPAGFHHLFLMVCYFALALFSRFSAIAVFFFLFTLVGAYRLIAQEGDKGLLILIFPVLYIYLFSLQQTMVVRNLMVMVPIFALCAARGLVDTYEMTKIPALKWGMIGLVVSMLLINGAWLLYASETITNRVKANYIYELSEYLTLHPSRNFSLSPAVQDAYFSRVGSLPPNAFANPRATSTLFVFYDSEIPKDVYEHWRPNHFNYVYKCFGPLNINLNYYDPHLVQNRHIIILRARDAATIGLVPSDGGF